MIKAFIKINTVNGRSYKYVRDVVTDTNGKNGEYYGYSGDTGDTLGDQTGAGKVLGDFLTLKANASSTTTKYLVFPESSGDTEILIRPNYEQTKDVSLKRETSILLSNIESIELFEMQVPEYFTGPGVY